MDTLSHKMGLKLKEQGSQYRCWEALANFDVVRLFWGQGKGYNDYHNYYDRYICLANVFFLRIDFRELFVGSDYTLFVEPRAFDQYRTIHWQLRWADDQNDVEPTSLVNVRPIILPT